MSRLQLFLNKYELLFMLTSRMAVGAREIYYEVSICFSVCYSVTCNTLPKPSKPA